MVESIIPDHENNSILFCYPLWPAILFNPTSLVMCLKCYTTQDINEETTRRKWQPNCSFTFHFYSQLFTGQLFIRRTIFFFYVSVGRYCQELGRGTAGLGEMRDNDNIGVNGAFGQQATGAINECACSLTSTFLCSCESMCFYVSNYGRINLRVYIFEWVICLFIRIRVLV